MPSNAGSGPAAPSIGRQRLKAILMLVGILAVFPLLILGLWIYGDFVGGDIGGACRQDTMSCKNHGRHAGRCVGSDRTGTSSTGTCTITCDDDSDCPSDYRCGDGVWLNYLGKEKDHESICLPRSEAKSAR